jgi:Transposase DDE domain
MERKLWPELYAEIRELAKSIRQKYVKIQPHVLLAVHCWAVLHDRPAAWACREENWAGTDDRPARLPSASTISRRLARVGFGVVLKALNDRLQEVREPAGTVSVDGKPLPVGGNSKDPDAAFGRGAGALAHGYKLHAIWGRGALPDAWDVTPLNRGEVGVALELLRRIPVVSGGWLLGDGNYDASILYDAAALQGRQLLTPRPKAKNPGCGKHYQSPHRLASLRLMTTAAGRRRYGRRTAIERRFGHLTGFAGGLAPLPAWVRGLRRVRAWVWTKLLLNAIRIRLADK